MNSERQNVFSWRMSYTTCSCGRLCTNWPFAGCAWPHVRTKTSNKQRAKIAAHQNHFCGPGRRIGTRHPEMLFAMLANTKARDKGPGSGGF